MAQSVEHDLRDRTREFARQRDWAPFHTPKNLAMAMSVEVAEVAEHFQWLPTGGVPWKYALIGGAVNALLFAAGNRALVYYFEVVQLTSAFGATAGFAAIMVWMYWTSLTILIGAQVGRSARDVLVDDRSREMVENDL